MENGRRCIFLAVCLLCLAISSTNANAQPVPKIELSVTSVVYGDSVKATHSWDKANGTKLSWYSYNVTPVGFYHRAEGKLVSLKHSGAPPVEFANLTTFLASPALNLRDLRANDRVGLSDEFKAELVGMFLITVEYTRSDGETQQKFKSEPVLLIVSPPLKDGRPDPEFVRSKKVLVIPSLQEEFEAEYSKQNK